ncbi:MAG: phage tail protein [Rubrivivax sp.]|nr:MAG: phage tail protein [Rubrivivax sp.]
MSEAIAEMILPSTYIEVRAEGLIGVGSIATGNLGIVGTAARGPVGEVVALGGYSDALDAFALYDPLSTPRLADNPLSLVRTLEQAFAGGARSVYAVRIANGTPVKAAVDVKTAGDAAGFTMTARDAGTWANGIRYTLTQAAAADPWVLKLSVGNTKEEFSGLTTADLHAALVTSTLVTVGALSNGAAAPVSVAASTPLAGGSDGANVSAADLAAGLALLADQPVNIVIVAGFGADQAKGAIGAHLEATENEGRERIAVLGAKSAVLADVEADIGTLNDDRIVLVAPGLKATDAADGKAVDLPPSYLAAVVAGKLATLAPHISLTNKTLPIDGLVGPYNTTNYKKLLQERVLLVRQKFGFQVVKGITTENAAFTQISVRRIVDYAKAGVRLGSDPYIGRLNNARVRAALKATLDGFLSQMVVDEMLVSYELDVSATRAQEIRGICAVTMTLMPTFSIDFIRVTMNLQ